MLAGFPLDPQVTGRQLSIDEGHRPVCLWPLPQGWPTSTVCVLTAVLLGVTSAPATQPCKARVQTSRSWTEKEAASSPTQRHQRVKLGWESGGQGASLSHSFMCQLNLAVMEESKSFTVCCLVCRLIVNLSPTPRRSVAEETHGRSWVGGDGGVIGRGGGSHQRLHLLKILYSPEQGEVEWWLPGGSHPLTNSKPDDVRSQPSSRQSMTELPCKFDFHYFVDESTTDTIHWIVLINTSWTPTCKSIKSVTGPASCIIVCSSCNHSLDSTLDREKCQEENFLQRVPTCLWKVSSPPCCKEDGSQARISFLNEARNVWAPGTPRGWSQPWGTSPRWPPSPGSSRQRCRAHASERCLSPPQVPHCLDSCCVHWPPLPLLPSCSDLQGWVCLWSWKERVGHKRVVHLSLLLNRKIKNI